MEPTVEHRNVATCGLRMTLAQPKAMVKNLVSRAFIESYREPGSRARHSIQHPGKKRSASYDDAQSGVS